MARAVAQQEAAAAEQRLQVAQAAQAEAASCAASAVQAAEADMDALKVGGRGGVSCPTSLHMVSAHCKRRVSCWRGAAHAANTDAATCPVQVELAEERARASVLDARLADAQQTEDSLKAATAANAATSKELARVQKELQELQAEYNRVRGATAARGVRAVPASAAWCAGGAHHCLHFCLMLLLLLLHWRCARHRSPQAVYEMAKAKAEHSEMAGKLAKVRAAACCVLLLWPPVAPRGPAAHQAACGPLRTQARVDTTHMSQRLAAAHMTQAEVMHVIQLTADDVGNGAQVRRGCCRGAVLRSLLSYKHAAHPFPTRCWGAQTDQAGKGGAESDAARTPTKPHSNQSTPVKRVSASMARLQLERVRKIIAAAVAERSEAGAVAPWSCT